MKKKPPPITVKLVASLTALAALATSMVAKVDPGTCLVRGAVGFFVGRFLASVWCALFSSITVETEDESETDTLEAEPEDLAAA